MNVLSLHYPQIKQQVLFKGAQFKNASKLPKSEDYDYLPLMTTLQVASYLEKEYKTQLNNIFFDSNGKLNDNIKQFLDETEFDFCLSDGSVEKKTLGQKLKESVREVLEIDCDLFHATSGMETAQKIITEGFNPQFISRTKFGPGFYFAGSEGDARNYGSPVLVVQCNGSYAQMKPNYYSDITSFSNALFKLKDFLGLKSNGYPTAQTEAQVCSRILNEYCRNYLVEELGIDFSYGSDGRSSAIIAHNLDKLTDIKFVS